MEETKVFPSLSLDAEWGEGEEKERSPVTHGETNGRSTL